MLRARNVIARSKCERPPCMAARVSHEGRVGLLAGISTGDGMGASQFIEEKFGISQHWL